MNTYYKQFMKYVALSQETRKREFTFLDLIEEVRKRMVTVGEKTKHAILILGFSGNGKTTYIKKYKEEHPEYRIVSMDKVATEIYKKKLPNTSDNIISSFGDVLEDANNKGNHIIIDGNFLNLLTRAALIDTLNSMGYQIDIIDLIKLARVIAELDRF